MEELIRARNEEGEDGSEGGEEGNDGRNERERGGGIMNQRKHESLDNKSLKYYTSAVDSMFNNVNPRKSLQQLNTESGDDATIR